MSAVTAVSWEDALRSADSATSEALERRLVERGQRGDREALEQLYSRYFDEIYAFVYRRVGDRHDAEDVTMQTFLKMVESIGGFRWRAGGFGAWLTRIARNLAVDLFRERVRFDRGEQALDREQFERASPSAEDETLAAAGERDVVTVLLSVGPEQRAALALRFMLSCSNADIALALAKTEGAVKALQHRGLEKIRAGYAADAA